MPAASVPTRNHHSAFAPENLTTLAHLSVSDAMNALKSAIASGIGSPPRSISRPLNCASASAALIILFSVATMDRWCSLGRPDPKPCGSLVARQKLANCRQVWQYIRAHRAGHREAAQLAGSDEIER